MLNCNCFVYLDLPFVYTAKERCDCSINWSIRPLGKRVYMSFAVSVKICPSISSLISLPLQTTLVVFGLSVLELPNTAKKMYFAAQTCPTEV